MCNSVEKEKSQLPLQSPTLPFSGEYAAKRVLCSLGADHLPVVVAQMR